MVTARHIVMSDRFKQRPKSNIGRTNSQLVYTSIIHNSEPWRRTDVAWGTEDLSSRPLSSHLGISSAKIGARHWTVNIGPDTGGFLPVLNVKRAETAHGRPREKLMLANNLNKKHSSDQSNTQKTRTNLITGANGTATASMFDLNTLVPPPPPNANSFINGLTAPSKKGPRPTLSPRNSSENWNPSPEFKMVSPADCDENKTRLTSPKFENTEIRTSPTLENLDKAKSIGIIIPTPPISNDKSAVNGMKSPETEDSIKFVENMSIPSKLKPILKAGSEDNATQTGKRLLSQTKFTIPLAPLVTSSPRQVSRRRTIHRSKKPAQEEERDSESGSKDEERLSIQSSTENLQSGEQTTNGKSVHFSAHADEVKEYIPWEAPNNSLINGGNIYSLPAMNISKFYEPFSLLDKKVKH